MSATELEPTIYNQLSRTDKLKLFVYFAAHGAWLQAVSKAQEKGASPERDRGIEPLFLPWEGSVEPIN